MGDFNKNYENLSYSDLMAKLDMDKIPNHVAIIMDGNGRWAKLRNLPRLAGHRAGIEALRDVIKTSSEIKIPYLTLYAFSTENWKRPVEEINGLMDLLVKYLKSEIETLNKNNIKIQVIGDISKLPVKAYNEVLKAIKKTSNNIGLTVNIALNYGGRDEIVKAIKKICAHVNNKEISIDNINEDTISSNLYTKDIPDPDLVIRTSGELRISNFLLWQIAYSELWFTETFWPDFTGGDLIMAILDYQNRKRRFGGI